MSQLSFLFAEDENLFGTPQDLLACAGKPVSLDTETTGLFWWKDRMLGVGVHCPPLGISKYIEIDSPDTLREVKRAVQIIAQDPASQVRMHNAKFDCHFLGINLWEARASFVDTTILAHLFDSRLRKNLGALETKFLGTTSKKRHLQSMDRKDLSSVARPVVAQYCINDCAITYDLTEHLLPELSKLNLDTLCDQQMKYLALLQKVEHRGLVLDYEFCERALRRFDDNLGRMEQELFSKTKTVFNWRSHDQLSVAIYEGMGVPRPKNPFADADGVDRSRMAHKGKYNRTKTSTFLLMERINHPLGALIQDMRETDKLKDTIENWKSLVDSNGVLHTSFNATGTRTGRLSSSDPNFQNVASDVRVRHTQSVYSGGVHRENEYNLRRGIVARPGHKFVSVDFSQQEMRLFALLAKEEVMIEAVKTRQDIHAMIAKEVWGDEIAKDPSLLKVRREWSKTISFGLLYGMTEGSLQYRLGKSRDESNEVARQYWTKFRRVKPYMNEVINECKKNGYVRYWSGRIWREDIERWMYKAVNALVQGGGADLLGTAALRVQKYLDEHDAGSIVNFVHDELISEVPTDMVPAIAPAIARIQEVDDLFNAPFLTEMKIGDSYGLLEKYEI